MFENWVMDITNGVENPCFCPYEDGDVIFGLSVMSSRCPGNLIGVLRLDGQEEVDVWIEDNPDWQERFAKGASDDSDL